jgi:hypothetical protein
VISRSCEEEEGDDERVDDQRLDEGEAENHRAADLVGGARVAGDAVEGGGGGAALAERATEGGDAEAERGAQRDEARVGGDRHLGALVSERDAGEAGHDQEGEERGELLGRTVAHGLSPCVQTRGARDT